MRTDVQAFQPLVSNIHSTSTNIQSSLNYTLNYSLAEREGGREGGRERREREGGGKGRERGSLTLAMSLLSLKRLFETLLNSSFT